MTVTLTSFMLPASRLDHEQPKQRRGYCQTGTGKRTKGHHVDQTTSPHSLPSLSELLSVGIRIAPAAEANVEDARFHEPPDEITYALL